MIGVLTSPRHARPCAGHPRLPLSHHGRKSWMAGTIPAMTLLGLCVLSSIVPAEPARAQSVEDFYRGKTINLIIGYSVGGGYDLYGRLVARHIGKHIPGKPNVVPQNMTGAGSLRAAQYIYTVAPK